MRPKPYRGRPAPTLPPVPERPEEDEPTVLEAHSVLDATAALLEDEEPVPAAPSETIVVPETPAGLARKLAAEAKARIETPADLARRLAAEAKARMTRPVPAPDITLLDAWDAEAETRIRPLPDDRVARAVAATAPGASVESVAAVRDLDEFQATWRARRAQAVRTGNLALAGMASALLDAADRGASLVAARVTQDGVAWAAWVDVDRGAVLGFAPM